MTTHLEAITSAADKAAFAKYRIARTDNTPHMYDNVRFYAVVIQYDPTQITALRRCVDVMMADLHGYGLHMLTGFIAAKSYYVVVIDTWPKPAVQSSHANPMPPRNGSASSARNGNGHVHSTNGNGSTRSNKVEFKDLPKAITSFEHWINDVGRQHLAHSDDEIVDYELESDGENSEVSVYMRSDEHHFTSKYVVTFDKSFAVTDILNVTKDDCKECMAEYADTHPERPI